MKVITLDEAGLHRDINRLESLAKKYDPDLILGIATGGALVAEKMFTNVPHYTVTNRRPGSEIKHSSKTIHKILKHLPLPVLNVMRILESRILSLHKGGPRARIEMNLPKCQRILVVDDAIDSGSTMATVLNSLPEGVEARVAVITRTNQRSIVNPDYTVYDNNTLIRFPWSSDAR